MISRYVKMAILWFVISRDVFNAPIDVAKAYAIWKATFYAIMKVKPFTVKVPEKNKKHTATNTTYQDIDYIHFPNGDAVKIDPTELEPVMILGKKQKQKIRPSDYDRKVYRKFQSSALYFEYEDFAKKLVKDKPAWVFKSKWYKEIWVKVRDLDWAEENKKLMNVKTVLEGIG